MATNWGEVYFDHYARFLGGDPDDTDVFEQDPNSPSIQMLTYARVFPECMTFASLGLTHYRKEVGMTVEVVVPVDGGFDEVPGLVANVLFHIVQHKITMGTGLAIDGIDVIDPAFAKTYGKNALYLTDPTAFPDGFAKLRAGKEKGSVLGGFFITQAEYDYYDANGADAFEDVLSDADIDPFVVARPSVV